MKNTKFSLSIFIAFLVFMLNCVLIQRTISLSLNLSNSNRNNNSISSTEKGKENKENGKSSKLMGPSPNLPNFTNMGFKCVKYKPRSMYRGQLCGYKGQKCLSKGIVFIGPLKDNEYKVVITKPLTQIDCNFEYFGVKEKQNEENSMSIKCSTHPLENDPDIVNYFSIIPANYYNHRVCINGEPGEENKGVLIKQAFKSSCESKYFGENRGLECKCYEVSFPEDYNDAVDDLYLPIRISSIGKYECIVMPGANMCNAMISKEACIYFTSKTTEVHQRNVVKIAEESLYKSIEEFFFDRWICPSESGLNVAIKYSSKKNEKRKDLESYSISCLGREGNDCFYGNNAESVCQKVVDCPDSIKEFEKLTCGTKEYKNIWFHDGFSTPITTWCKSANAWLRFDGTFKMTDNKTKKIGLVMLGDGTTACIPDIKKDFAQCMIENSTLDLQKEIEYYNNEISSIEKYSTLLKCKEEALLEAVKDENHWCFKPLILPESNGEFKLKSGINNIKLSLGKYYSEISNKKHKFLYSEAWMEDIQFKEINYDSNIHSFFVEDLNGDKLKDLVVFHDKGVWVSLNKIGGEDTNEEFSEPSLWTNEFGVNSTTLSNNKSKHLVFLIDVNKDNKLDIVFFGDEGVYVSLNTGKSFQPAENWIIDYGYNQGWRV